MISGVAGGIAEYFDVDPTLMRVGWVILCLASFGMALIAYVALAVILPTDDSGDSGGAANDATGDEPRQTGKQRRRFLLAFAFICVGTIFLASNLGLFFWWRWDVLWPTVLIAIGGLILFGRYRKKG